MRTKLPERLETGRIVGYLSWGAHGVFDIQGPMWRAVAHRCEQRRRRQNVQRLGEYVSVSTRRRPPNWTEMCLVKALFWDPEECVVQFHPPESQYVNNHPYCLHLWRNKNVAFPMPPPILVGIKSEGVLTNERAAELRQECLP